MSAFNALDKKFSKKVRFEITALRSLENELKHRYNIDNFTISGFEVLDFEDFNTYSIFFCVGFVETDTKAYVVYFDLTETSDEYSAHINSIDEYERS